MDCSISTPQWVLRGTGGCLLAITRSVIGVYVQCCTTGSVLHEISGCSVVIEKCENGKVQKSANCFTVYGDGEDRGWTGCLAHGHAHF